MTTTTEEKDLVWLPKSLAIKIKDIQDGKVLEAEILKYAEQSKQSLQNDIESIEDSILQYRAYMIKAKNAFREAKDEQLDATYALWEKFEDDMKGLRDFVGKAKAELEPLKKELNEVKKLMGEVDKWGIKDLLDTIKTLNNHYYGETANILQFLLSNYKRPNSTPNVQESDTTEA